MINEKYSYKAFPYHNLSFKHIPAKEFDNTEIVGSCFYQEYTTVDTNVVKDIFPNGMKGVTFIKCNLDNVLIPQGNTIDGGCNRIIKVQNDLNDWELNEDFTPKKQITYIPSPVGERPN
jgi:hypothetical protein